MDAPESFQDVTYHQKVFFFFFLLFAFRNPNECVSNNEGMEKREISFIFNDGASVKKKNQ